MTQMSFEVTRREDATPSERIAQVLENPGFGKTFTDHMVVIDWSGDGGWTGARVKPYGPFQLDPAAAVLHYGQEIFEGMKAYRHADGSIWTFRPEANAARFARSARRLALPELPEADFIESLRQLVSVDQEWVPGADGEKSLYLRPFMFASEAFLGVRPAQQVTYSVIASPAGSYFTSGVKPVTLWISTAYARAGAGGTGAAKCGGNYASSLAGQLEGAEHGCDQAVFLDSSTHTYIEELGGMNLFLVYQGRQDRHAGADRHHPRRRHPGVDPRAGQGARPRARGAAHPHRRVEGRRCVRRHRGDLRLRHRSRHHARRGAALGRRVGRPPP